MQKIKILLPVFSFVCTFCFAQQGSVSEIESIAAPLIKNLRLHNKERILVETDRKFYAPGETIWFKAYIIDSFNNRVTYKNKTLFVDLVNDQDSVINRLLLHGDKASANGSLVLNDSLQQGYYWLRAYTKKMIHENMNNISIQAVYIVNGRNKKNTLSSSQAHKVTATGDPKVVVDIYPEGGWLISGTTSVVAVKVHDQSGKALALPGVVKDNHDAVVAKFIANSQGAAKFSLTPKWFGKYKVCIQNNGKYDSVGILPRVNPFAAQLSVVEQNEQSIKVRVMLEDSIYTKEYETYILGLSKDSVCFAGVGKGIYELNIPLSDFPGGIAKLLLFNAKKDLISIRNVYINKKNVSVNLTTNKQTYAARENVKMDIAVTDAMGKPLLASLFVSVVDAGVIDTTTVLFANPLAALTPSDADLLMLVNTEQDENLFKPQKTETKQAVNSINDDLKLKGQVVNSKGKPAAGQQVLLVSNEKEPLYLIEKTDSAGKFSFLLPDYNDGTQFSLRVKNEKEQTQEYGILTEPVELPRFATPAALKEKDKNEKVITEKAQIRRIDSIMNSNAVSLQPVTVKTTAAKESGTGKKNSADIITQEELQSGGVNNVGQAVLRSGKFHLVSNYLMSGGSNGFAPSAKDEPIVIMDGIQVSVASDNQEVSPVLSYLKMIPTNEIEYIKLLTGTEGSSYGVRGGHGIIEIHSASKVNTSTAPAKAATTVVPKGFHIPANFVMPDYANKENKKSKTPDLRTTIYWNGDVITDTNGKAKLNFYTADLPATYFVTVAGITANGDKFSQTTIIKRE